MVKVVFYIPGAQDVEPSVDVRLTHLLVVLKGILLLFLGRPSHATLKTSPVVFLLVALVE